MPARCETRASAFIISACVIVARPLIGCAPRASISRFLLRTAERNGSRMWATYRRNTYLYARARSLAYSRTCHALLAGGHAPAIARNAPAFLVFFYCYFREIPAAKTPRVARRDFHRKRSQPTLREFSRYNITLICTRYLKMCRLKN